MFCAISSQKVYGPFFAEETLTGMTCMDMLQLWHYIFQQDISPAHFHCEVRQYLNTALPGRWIGCASGNDQPLMPWPPRSPDFMPCDFFLWKWKYVKDWVFIPLLPRDLSDLKAWIIAAAKKIDAPMLTHVWQEPEYCVSMCAVSPVMHT